MQGAVPHHCHVILIRLAVSEYCCTAPSMSISPPQQPLSRQPLQTYLLALSLLQQPEGSTSTRGQRKPGMCEGMYVGREGDRQSQVYVLTTKISTSCTKSICVAILPNSSTMRVWPWREFLQCSSWVMFSIGIQWNTCNTLGTSSSVPYCGRKQTQTYTREVSAHSAEQGAVKPISTVHGAVTKITILSHMYFCRIWSHNPWSQFYVLIGVTTPSHPSCLL